MKKLIILIVLLVSLLPSVSTAQTDTPEAQISELVTAMQTAVLARDLDTYKTYVDWRAPYFAEEHTHWAEDWAEEDFLSQFELAISDIQVAEAGDFATGTLSLTWSTIYEYQEGGTAVFPVQFTLVEGKWLYAGEYWIVTETEHFIVHAAPGLEAVAAELIPNLPEIYTNVTADLEYTPNHAMHIKLYNSMEAIVSTTLMSLPPFIGWNEPRESLKLAIVEGRSLEGIVAHEFTHFLEFDMSDQAHTLMPWWVSEGIAQVLAQPFDPRGEAHYRENVLAVVQEWTQNEALLDWALMETFAETPAEYWRYVYPQGYAFIRFVTETYGEQLRNDWLSSMGRREFTVKGATLAYLGKSFADLDAEFREWILAFNISGEKETPPAIFG